MKVALIDADSLLYYEMGKDTLEEAMMGIDDRITTILETTSADAYFGFLTEGKCFRYRLARTRPYKYNRKLSTKPPIFYALREYIKQRWGFKGILGLEADDCVSVYSTIIAETEGQSYVICSPDKDVLRQVPGRHFNFQKMEWVNTSDKEANEFLWMQTLMGDSTDGIPGIPGLGAKTAEKIINANDGTTSYEQDVLKIYVEKFGQYDGICKFTETFKLVYLLKTEEDILYNIRKPLEPIEFISINS
mgnify:FL=1|tara:strand:- start:2741 stop:3481 length:741 start_codon:yes stop_codon:yes gene_type:complete